jgi:hypothetical protein
MSLCLTLIWYDDIHDYYSVKSDYNMIQKFIERGEDWISQYDMNWHAPPKTKHLLMEQMASSAKRLKQHCAGQTIIYTVVQGEF